MGSKDRIQIFEYEKLTVGITYGQQNYTFKKRHFDSLVKWNEFYDNQYFNVGHKNIRAQNYVGVIQIDGLTIEILPKVDRTTNDKTQWQEVLIEMLRATQKLNVRQVGHAQVNKQSIHLLDIYFEWFLNELQLLLHQGLIRQYYRKQSNRPVLKGKLLFSQHIRANVVHKERFFTEHQTYDYDHLIHQILNRALDIVTQLSKGSYLYGFCKTIALDFPDTKRISVDEKTFGRLPRNRKTKPYDTALEIARLIILNYAPNVTKGNENMLALLFDMNALWEGFVTKKLKRAARDYGLTVLGQDHKTFWNTRKIRPDIIIQRNEKTVFILDTKWKLPSNNRPSMDDLRQMYVYNRYWRCKKSMLLYPGAENEARYKGIYNKIEGIESYSNEPLEECSVEFITILNEEGKIDTDFGHTLLKRLGFEKVIKEVHHKVSN